MEIFKFSNLKYEDVYGIRAPVEDPAVVIRVRRASRAAEKRASRKASRHTNLLLHRDIQNLSMEKTPTPVNPVKSKKPAVEKKPDRRELLVRWQAEKEQRIKKQKSLQKPIFRAAGPTNIGFPGFPSFAPNNKSFTAPSNIKPIHLNLPPKTILDKSVNKSKTNLNKTASNSKNNVNVKTNIKSNLNNKTVKPSTSTIKTNSKEKIASIKTTEITKPINHFLRVTRSQKPVASPPLPLPLRNTRRVIKQNEKPKLLTKKVPESRRRSIKNKNLARKIETVVESADERVEEYRTKAIRGRKKINSAGTITEEKNEVEKVNETKLVRQMAIDQNSSEENEIKLNYNLIKKNRKSNSTENWFGENLIDTQNVGKEISSNDNLLETKNYFENNTSKTNLTVTEKNVKSRRRTKLFSSTENISENEPKQKSKTRYSKRKSIVKLEKGSSTENISETETTEITERKDYRNRRTRHSIMPQNGNLGMESSSTENVPENERKVIVHKSSRKSKRKSIKNPAENKENLSDNENVLMDYLLPTDTQINKSFDTSFDNVARKRAKKSMNSTKVLKTNEENCKEKVNTLTIGELNNSATEKSVSKTPKKGKVNGSNPYLSTSYSSAKSSTSLSDSAFETPENKNISKVYISPFVTTSRGKGSKRQSKGLTNFSDNLPANNEAGTAYFHTVLDNVIERLLVECDAWIKYKEAEELSSDVCDMIDVAVGQTHLLINKKFQQFRNLIYNCQNGDGEGTVTCADLQGFWDMVYIQVDNLDIRFKRLTEMKANNWEELKPIVQKKAPIAKKRTQAAKRPPAKPRPNIRDAIKAKMKAQKSSSDSDDNVFNGVFFVVQSPKKSNDVKTPSKTPNKRKSLLASVLSTEASKKVSRNRSSGLTTLRLSQTFKTIGTENKDRLNQTMPTPGKSILKKSNSVKAHNISKVVLFKDDDDCED